MEDDFTKSPHYSIDPFPSVDPSLLNSFDIVRYAEKGCLVRPFLKEEELLNPATYTIPFLGTLFWWRPESKGLRRRQHQIKKGQTVPIPANSISYLLTEVEFRLPQYIAARFNLHIRHVHKGILLGTGPLVDPGFVGQLLVPLHNLTDNDYTVSGGDNLLWVEFTKLSTHDYWNRCPTSDERRDDDLVAFPASKLRLSADSYFAKAGITEMPGVLSAFKGALEDARNQATTSRRESEAAKREATQGAIKLERLTFWGGLGLLAGIAALIFASWQLWQGNNDMLTNIDERLDKIEHELRTPQRPQIERPSQLLTRTDVPPADRDSEPKPSEEAENISDDSASRAPHGSERKSGEGDTVATDV